MTNIEAALNVLSRQGKAAPAILDAILERRKESQYVKYWLPQPQQAKALEAWTPQTKTFVVLGGNRAGKTELGAFLAVVWALGKDYFRDEPAWDYVKDLPIPEPPNTIWIVGLDYKALQNVIWNEKLLKGRDHPPLLPLGEIKKESVADLVIELNNGSLIQGKSAESGREKFQSASVDLVWIDEEPEEEIYDECYQRTVDCKGKILVTVTPLKDTSSGNSTPWLFNLYEEKRDDPALPVTFVKMSILDNPYVPEEEKEQLIKRWAGRPEEKARLYGDFYQRSGLVYNTFNPDVHLIDPCVLPDYYYTVVCIDPAPTGPTAALWAKADSRGNLTFFKEYKEANLTVSAHAKNILVRNQGKPVDLWLIDPKGGSQRNAETHKTIAQLYRENRIPVRAASLGSDYGMAESKEFIEAALDSASRHPKALFFRDLGQFRDEITHYSWAAVQRGDRKGEPSGKPIKRNDHLMNCYQYICAMRPRARVAPIPPSPEERRANSYT